MEADQRRRVGSLPEVHLMEDPANSVRRPNQTPPEPPTPPSQSAGTPESGVYTSKHTAETSGARVAGTVDELTSLNREALERTTTTLSIRIPIRHRLIYDKLTHKEKYYFKLGVLALLEALGRGDAKGVVGPVVINLNLNVQSQEVHQVHPDELLRRDLELRERRLRLCLDELDLAKRERRGLDRRLAECERLRARLRQVLGELSQLQHLYRQGVLRTGGEVVRKLGELAAKLREDLD